MELTEAEKAKLIINAVKNAPLYLDKAKKTFETMMALLKNDFMFLSNKYFEGFKEATGENYAGDDISMKDKWLIFLRDSRENIEIVLKELEKEEPFICGNSNLTLFKPRD